METQTTTTEQRIKEMLSGQRGHFAAALANAYQYADSNNQARLHAAFPHLFGVQECTTL